MRGKIVNLCIGFMNVLLGILIIIYTIKVPQDKTLMTVQENFVANGAVIAIYAITVCTAIINFIQSYHHRSDTTFNTGYFIGIFVVSFFFIKQPTIGAFSLICGLIVLVKSLKENLIELNSTTAISVSIVIMAAILITGFVSFNYDVLGKKIKDSENKDELAYKTDYFKYITELNEDRYTDVYINIKKDGKFGYINSNGECVINFIYDYASPFVEIMAYGKRFQIALVCKDGSSYIILKNGREVLSYRTESSDDNYGAKLEELKDVYISTLNQEEPMKFEIEKITDYKNKAKVYKEVAEDYTFRYDYNNEYDIIVTQSNMGLGDRYELAKKDNLDIRITLDTTYLDYDTSYLYLFSDGTIPFYETSRKTQGWFTSYGKKNEMTGNAQILDFIGERILLKDYNKNTIYFTDTSGEILSEQYKDIFICNDGRYIVKESDGYFKFIDDDDYNQIFEKKYAAVNTRLISEDLYLVLDSTSNIKFNDYGYGEMTWSLINYDGEVIFDGIEAIYDELFKLPEDNDIEEENYLIFEKDLKSLDYEFVGDKFYLNY